jgi:SAM-dependent methyltransferase
MFRRLVASPTLYDVLQRLVGHAEFERRLARHLHGLPQRARIVDIGGGTGTLGTTVNGARYVRLDIDADKLARSRHEGEIELVVQGDATACPLVSACADAVICAKVTHHLNDEALTTVFAEMLRLVSPGGVVIVADAVASPRFLPRVLWSIDRGSHVRSAEAIVGAVPDTASLVARERFRLGRFHEFVLLVVRPNDRRAGPRGSAAA